MKEPTYRQAFSHAWDVVWHNKTLWILGLFSALLGQFGFSDIFGKIWSISNWSVFDTSFMGQQVSLLLPAIKLNWSGDISNVLGVIWLTGIIMSLLVLLVFLAVSSQGALIAYVADWFKTKKHQALIKPWNRSLNNFWNILLVNVVRKILLAISLSLFGFALSYFLFSKNLQQSFVLALGLVIVLLISLFVSIICIFTLSALIVDNKGLKSAVKKGWSVFWRHTLVSLEVGVLLMLFNFLLLLAILFSAFFAFLPAVLIWLIAGMTNIVVLATIGFSLGVFLWLVFIVLLAGFFNAYTTSAWVFLFMKMNKEGVSSRVINLFKHFFGNKYE